MSLDPLPTAWNRCHLVSSPFFQGALEEEAHGTRRLSLFVGRKQELRRIAAAVRGAGAQSTRHAIAGAPGIGKTTLVQGVKAELQADGYLSTASHVQILPDDSAAALFGRILAAVYEIWLVNRPTLKDSAAMKAAEALVRVFRTETLGASVSIAGFGGGVTHGSGVSVPSDMLVAGPAVLRGLLGIVRTADVRGVLLHLNNLENLAEREAHRAADVLRSLRDVVFQADGLHTLIVGTADAVQQAVNRHPQIRTVFTTVVVEPLPLADVHTLLAARYKALRISDRKRVTPPVRESAVDALYALFRGDLRGLLKALEDATGALIGTAAPPFGIDDLRPVLRARYRTELQLLSERTRIEQLDQWGQSSPAATHTQASLSELWKVKQSAVSLALAYLQQQGFVVCIEPGRPAAYALSGTSRLVYG